MTLSTEQSLMTLQFEVLNIFEPWSSATYRTAWLHLNHITHGYHVAPSTRRLPTDDLILRESTLDDFIRCYCVLHGFVHSGWIIWKAKTFTRYVLESCRMSTISSTKDRFRIKNTCTQGSVANCLEIRPCQILIYINDMTTLGSEKAIHILLNGPLTSFHNIHRQVIKKGTSNYRIAMVNKNVQTCIVQPFLKVLLFLYVFYDSVPRGAVLLSQQKQHQFINAGSRTMWIVISPVWVS